MRFLRNSSKSNSNIVWGIRAPESVRIRWTKLSEILGVPCNRLILFIITDWLIRNSDNLFEEEWRVELANNITKAYLAGKLD